MLLLSITLATWKMVTIFNFRYAIFYSDYINHILGKKFDSTLDEGREPLKSTLGKIGLQGWEEALKGACPGETRLVFIPYELVRNVTVFATFDKQFFAVGF